MKLVRTFLYKISIFSFFLFSGIFSCTGSSSPGAAPGPLSGNASNAGPQTPSMPVDLAPSCEKGAKPTERCPGSPFPVPLRPCPSNLTVIKDADAGIWWCGCPANTTEEGSAENPDLKRCVCPSGQALFVNVDTGEALGCPELPSSAAQAAPTSQAPCRPGLVLLMPVQEGHVNFCGCPTGTEHIYPPNGGAAIGCRCPSGSVVEVDPNTSEMVGACPPVQLGGGHGDECTLPCTKVKLGAKTTCNCPFDLRKNVDLPQVLPGLGAR